MNIHSFLTPDALLPSSNLASDSLSLNVLWEDGGNSEQPGFLLPVFYLRIPRDYLMTDGALLFFSNSSPRCVTIVKVPVSWLWSWFCLYWPLAPWNSLPDIPYNIQAYFANSQSCPSTICFRQLVETLSPFFFPNWYSIYLSESVCLHSEMFVFSSVINDFFVSVFITKSNAFALQPYRKICWNDTVRMLPDTNNFTNFFANNMQYLVCIFVNENSSLFLSFNREQRCLQRLNTQDHFDQYFHIDDNVIRTIRSCQCQQPS